MTVRIGPALAEALRISFDDASADWFPPVGPSVEALSWTDAMLPGPDGNAPWQILDHLRIGYAVWGEYLASGRFDPEPFGGGREWQPVRDGSADAWDALRGDTRTHEASYRAVVVRLSDEELLTADPAQGGTTRLDVVLSTLAHLAFHAGELAAMTSKSNRSAAPEAAPVR